MYAYIASAYFAADRNNARRPGVFPVNVLIYAGLINICYGILRYVFYPVERNGYFFRVLLFVGNCLFFFV